MEISLAAEKLFQIGNFPITNSLLTAWGVMSFLIILGIVVGKKVKEIPAGFINFVEWVIEGLFGLFDSVTQDRKLTKKFFPIVATIFIFVIVSNWTEILPGVGSVGLKHNKEVVQEKEERGFVSKAEAKAEKNEKKETKPEIIPIFRAPSSDLNFTLGLAIISVGATQIFGILSSGFFRYIKKFINFRGPINFFVGILELVSEFAKVISFSLRLFGNIFAGEVLLFVIAFLVPLFAPVPFYFLEIFVGFVQALIFSMLTLVFLTIAAKAGEHE